MPPAWALALALATLAAAAGATASHEQQQCVCTSTHFDDVTFSITCERNATGSWAHTQGASGAFKEDSSVSCKRGAVPKAGPDYRPLGDFGFYKFHRRHTTWEDALRSCAREGANLAVANSEGEAEALKGLFADHPDLGEVWVGINDLKTEGRYLTLKGETLQQAGWEKWREGEPNNAGGAEHCIIMDFSGHLNDISCDAPRPFFCERRS